MRTDFFNGNRHNQNVAHRDIKPGNILIDKDTGMIKITDFGVSAIFEKGAGNDGDDEIDLTKKTAGTTMFMAPEVSLRLAAYISLFCAAILCKSLLVVNYHSWLLPKETTGEMFHAIPCDLWSVAVTLYYMLYGTIPFTGKTVSEVYESIQNHEPSYPSTTIIKGEEEEVSEEATRYVKREQRV